jgi:FtsP/CotA-like multicopper oxidase with cupredoxin domain
MARLDGARREKFWIVDDPLGSPHDPRSMSAPLTSAYSVRTLALASGLALAVTGCGGETTPPEGGPPSGWDRDVALTPAKDLDPDPRVLDVALDARVADVTLRSGQTTSMWTYGGTFPGPLLRAKKGDRLVVHFTNHLPVETTIHWHGIRVPNPMDGTPDTQDPVPPGGSFDYDFTLPDAGTYWYHPHIRSDEEVERGLYGALVVDDPDEPRIADDVVLLLDDVLLDDDGSVAPPGTHLDDLFGREGNVVLVNGRVMPTLRARPGAWQRWRLVNAANARYFDVAVDGHAFVQLGTGGGLLEAPRATERVLLAPGERADVVLAPHGTAGDELAVRSMPFDRGYGTGLEPVLDVMTLSLEGTRAPKAPALPEKLATIDPIPTAGAVEKTIELTQSTNAEGEAIMGIDGIPFPDAPPVEAKVGETHVWSIVNATEAHHPFHLHGFRFQPLDVGGVPFPYRAWKDTLDVPAQKTARFAVSFDDRPGMWMFHCHILEHAKIGMMGMLMLSE